MSNTNRIAPLSRGRPGYYLCRHPWRALCAPPSFRAESIGEGVGREVRCVPVGTAFRDSAKLAA